MPEFRSFEEATRESAIVEDVETAEVEADEVPEAEALETEKGVEDATAAAGVELPELAEAPLVPETA